MKDVHTLKFDIWFFSMVMSSRVGVASECLVTCVRMLQGKENEK